ncbi:hypothetical protein AAG570_011511 [Ranatra chinensis]|uniref:CAAX prenyl protease n=1 Tax=Ranatra chinensis TaxID=642074 RepID=A0ABD0YKV2_9HEMI
MFQDFYNVILSSVLIWYLLIFHIWECSHDFLMYFSFENNEILQTAAFICITSTISAVTALPLSIYKTFILEEKHGFNKQTPVFFVKDWLKSYLLTIVIVPSLSCIAVYIVKIGGDYFFVYLWLFAMVTMLFFMTVYADYIAPLFDTYTPLPDGDLRTKIEGLAASIKFPLYKLYLVEGSKRSVHSNAYFYGFFNNKRIVLFDTLVKDYYKSEEKNDNDDKKGCDTEEVLAILAHELGHWKHNHVLKQILIMQFCAFGFLFQYPQLYQAFGFVNEKPVIVGLIVVLQFIFSPYNSVMSFLLIILSRKYEFQADRFAKSLGKAKFLKKALIKLGKDNLSFPVYDWLYSSWHHSHPTLLQRLKHLDKED